MMIMVTLVSHHFITIFIIIWTTDNPCTPCIKMHLISRFNRIAFTPGINMCLQCPHWDGIVHSHLHFHLNYLIAIQSPKTNFNARSKGTPTSSLLDKCHSHSRLTDSRQGSATGSLQKKQKQKRPVWSILTCSISETETKKCLEEVSQSEWCVSQTTRQTWRAGCCCSCTCPQWNGAFQTDSKNCERCFHLLKNMILHSTLQQIEIRFVLLMICFIVCGQRGKCC